jgi:Gram-negative bacterial TonB protein C-terminal
MVTSTKLSDKFASAADHHKPQQTATTEAERGSSLGSALVAIEQRVMSGNLEKTAALARITEAIANVPGLKGAMIAFRRGPDLICFAGSGSAPLPGTQIACHDGPYDECLANGRLVVSDHAALNAPLDVFNGGIPSGPMLLLPLHPGKANSGILAVFAAPDASVGEHITAFGTAALLASLVSTDIHSKLSAPVQQEPTLRPSPQFQSDLKLPPHRPAAPEVPASKAGGVDLSELLRATRQIAPHNQSLARNRKLRKVAAFAALIVLCSGTLLASFCLPRQSAKRVHLSSPRELQFEVTEVAGQPSLAEPNSSTSAAEIMPGTPIQHRLPSYPQSALGNYIQGDVSGVMLVTETGVVVDITIIRGDTILAQAMSTALAHWRYTPFKIAGQPVAVRIPVTVSYRLQRLAK